MIIGTGIDLIEIGRIKEAAQSKAFLERVFTEPEMAFFKSKNFNPQSIAGLFAAKEAVSKAFGLGIGDISWQDIIIGHDENGAPQVCFSKTCCQMIAGKYGTIQVHLSITHSKTDAAAFAIVERADER